ncbi:hypothetical protein HCN56_14645, partial [Streptomyces lonarensis]|nr:hypothetical protein [Streptomyces lonarensis]
MPSGYGERAAREGNAINEETSGPAPFAAGEADDPGCLRPGEAQRLLARARWRRLVVIGDIPVERSAEPVPGYAPWPWYDRVAAALREVAAHLAYLNLLGRRPVAAAQVRSVQLPAALAFRGDLALVCWGAGYAPRESPDLRGPTAELTRTVAPLRDAGYDVALVGLGPAARSGAAVVPVPTPGAVGVPAARAVGVPAVAGEAGRGAPVVRGRRVRVVVARAAGRGRRRAATVGAAAVRTGGRCGSVGRLRALPGGGRTAVVAVARRPAVTPR